MSDAAKGSRGSTDGDVVLPGSWYQDTEVTGSEVLGILGVIVALGVFGWLFLRPAASLVITEQDVAQASSGAAWPLAVEEVTVQCRGEDPVYRLVPDVGETRTITGGLANVPTELRAVDAEGTPLPLMPVQRIAHEFCRA